MRRYLSLALIFFVFAIHAAPGRFNTIVTINSSTPVQLATTSTVVNRLFVQMLIGGTGYGCVMAGIPTGVTPSCSTSGQLTAQLAPATSTSPGGSYSDVGPDIDLAQTYIGGSHTGDTVVVSWDAR